MIRINDDDRAFLVGNLPDVEKLISSGEINDILSLLDDWIFVHGLTSEDGKEYVLNPIGRKAQRVYDRLYYDNSEVT